MKSAISERCFKIWAVIAFFLLMPCVQAYSGNIHTKEKFAWSENTGWLNLRPVHKDVTVHENYLSGYIWGENIGWIKLGASNSGPYANKTSSDWGVNIFSNGFLYGYAWSENVGWINFNTSQEASSVWLDEKTGEIRGFAWGANIGYIHFKGSASDETDYTVTTPRITINDSVAEEGDGTIKFTVSMSTTTNVNVSVTCDVFDGTDDPSQAKAYSVTDYNEVVASVVIRSGQTSGEISIDLKEDVQQEPAEYFTLKIISAPNASIQDDTGIGKILDDDGHTITLNVGENGSITTETGTSEKGYSYSQINAGSEAKLSVDHNDDITITMFPEPGYKISALYQNDTFMDLGEKNWYSISEIKEDYQLDFQFVETDYEITIGSDIQNGSCEVIGTSTGIPHNDTRTIKCTGIPNYHIESLTICDDDITAAKNATSYEHLFNVIKDCHVAATFAIDEFDITADVTSGVGTITAINPQGTSYTDSENRLVVNVEYDQSQTFRVSPDDYHHIKDVFVDGLSVLDACTFNGTACDFTFQSVQSDYSITAALESNTYTLVMLVGDGGYMTYTDETGDVEVHDRVFISVDYLSSRTIKVYPNTDLKVADVSLDGQSLIRKGSDNPYIHTFSNISNHHVIYARFSHILVTQKDDTQHGSFTGNIQFNTIQDALNNADSGDIIAVDPGVYSEQLDFPNKSLTIFSVQGPEATIIDANKETSCIKLSNIDETVNISGFTFKNGYAVNGGGIYILNASPTISDCHIIDNEASVHGGGIYVSRDAPASNVAPEFIELYIRGNIAGEYGGGLYCESSNSTVRPKVYQSNIRGNIAGINGGGIYVNGISYDQLGDLQLESSWIIENQTLSNGAGIYVNNYGKISIFGTTISNNRYEDGYGGAIYANVYPPQGAELPVNISNSILWENGREIDGNTQYIDVKYSSIDSDANDFLSTNNNYNYEPDFADTNIGDYHLGSLTNCKNKGVEHLPDGAYSKDIDGNSRKSGTTIDLGGDEYDNLMPAVNFSASTQRSGTAPLTVTFTDLTTNLDNTTVRIWEFGDGTISNEKNPVHVYNQPGLYTVQLTAFNGSGYSSTLKRFDYINVSDTDAVDLNFIAAPSDITLSNTTFDIPDIPGVAGFNAFTVKFYNLTSGNFVPPPSYAKWEWNFGDGGATSSEESPVHTYYVQDINQKQTFSVKLTAHIPGDSGELVKKVFTRYHYVTILDPEPQAAFEIAPSECIKSDSDDCTVTIYDRSFSYTDIKEWTLTFGNGDASNYDAPFKYNTYTYTDVDQDYNIILNISDKNNSANQEINLTSTTSTVMTIDDSDSIQDAIDNKCGDDEESCIIVLSKETPYYENIDTKNKNLTIKSQTDQKVTISGNGSDSVIKIINGKTVYLEGLIIELGGKADFGGGILVDNGSRLILKNCIVQKNSATIAGGGIAFLNNSSGVIDNSVIGDNDTAENKNSAPYGAGVACLYGASPLFVNNTYIAKNEAKMNGGGIYAFNANPIILDITLKANTATWKGGGLYISQAQPRIEGTSILINKAHRGGGIYLENATFPIIRRAKIQENISGLGGAGIYSKKSIAPQIMNTLITENRSDLYGGGIYLDGVSSANFLFSTIAQNVANYTGTAGDALYGNQLSPGFMAKNCIFKNGNEKIQIVLDQYSEPPIIEHSAIAQTVYQSSTNIDDDPLFLQYDATVPDYHLQTGSPCQDKADTASLIIRDLDGNMRTVGSAPDMGVYESNEWPITFRFNDSNGRISIDGNAGTLKNGDIYGIEDSGTQTFIIDPENGYTLTELIVDGEPVQYISDGSRITYTFSSVDEGHILTATFERYNIPVTIIYVGEKINSTTNPVETGLNMTSQTETDTETWYVPGVNTKVINVFYDTSLTLTTKPIESTQTPEFTCDKTEEPVYVDNNTRRFENIKEPTNITVTAHLKRYEIVFLNHKGIDNTTITIQDSNGNNISSPLSVRYGETQSLEAEADTDFVQFESWSGFEPDDSKITINGTKITISDIQQDYTLNYKFDYKDLKLTVRREGSGGKIKVTWNSEDISEYFDTQNIDDGIEKTIKYNDTLELETVNVFESWKFDGWSWANNSDSNSTHKWENIKEDLSITANFSLDIKTLRIEKSSNANGSGKVSINGTVQALPIVITYPYNTYIEAEAIADSYSSNFKEWSGDESGSERNIRIQMDKDKVVYVDFQLKKYAITASSPKAIHGSISPQGITLVSFGGDQTYFLTPNKDKYLFDLIIDNESMLDKWGQIPDNYRQHTFTDVKANHSIEAIFGQTIKADTNTTIQSKISDNGTQDGDTVLVAPGVYKENILFRGKNIHVKAEKPFQTIIDGQFQNSVVRFIEGESRHAKISGCIIRHGGGVNRSGGGIYIDDSSPTIENCRIEDNSVSRNGGGIYVYGDSSDPLIEGTIIQNNFSGKSGAGIYSYKSFATLSRSIIRQNRSELQGGGIYAEKDAHLTLRNMLIYDNFTRYTGGGMAINNASTVIQHATISDNHAGQGLSLFVEQLSNSNEVTVQNSIFWQSNGLAYQVIETDSTSSVLVSNSDIFQDSGRYEGPGNINEDPMFTDPETGNYRIINGSPVIDKAENLEVNDLALDFDGNPRPFGADADMGAFEWDNHNMHLDFYASDMRVSPGMSIEFKGYAYDGTSNFDDNDFAWTFGDLADTGVNPTAPFTTPGVNTAKLTVGDYSKTQIIVVDELIAGFTVNTTAGYAPLQIDFTDMSVGSPKTWTWKFGDSEQSYERNPTHIYEQYGEYTVQLIVFDDQGNKDIVIHYGCITVLNPIPEVDFIVSRTIGKSPLNVQFFDTTNAYQVVNDWSWSLGDNSFPNIQNPPNTYDLPGKYTVILTVKTEDGSFMTTKKDLIEVKSFAEEKDVCKFGNCDFDSIQAAIDASQDGDSIIVRNGSYSENISFNGKNIKVYSENGPSAATIIAANSDSVVTFSQKENSGAILQGFTIIEGNAPYGGGILIANGSSPSISNCTIKNNTATESGGGIAVMDSDSNPYLAGVRITSNTAPNGGGLAIMNQGQSFLRSVEIYKNTAKDSGGGIYVFADATLTTRQVTVKDNTAANYGGGVYLNQTSVILRDLTIKNNDASYGNGIAMRANDTTLIDQCHIENIDDHLAEKGGGIYAWDCNAPEIRNSVIVKNDAKSGGGIYFDNVSSPLIHFSTLADNHATYEGKGVYAFFNTSGVSKHVTIRNSILWNEGNEIKTEPENMAIVTYSNIQDDEWMLYPGNINQNPKFTKDSQYHLDTGSPCKNEASSENAPNVDIGGNDRPLGIGFDMGAVESTNVEPEAYQWTEYFLEDEPKSFTLKANDEDGDPLTYEIIRDPAHGTLTGSGAIRTYKPGPDFNGSDYFIFKVNDGNFDSNETTVNIQVDPVNDAPVFTINKDKIEVSEDTGLHRELGFVTNISKGSSNESSQTVQFLVSTKDEDQYLFSNLPSISPDGTLEFTPAQGQTGSTLITVQLQDNGNTNNNGQDTSEKDYFTIEIKDINDRPEFTINSAYEFLTACEDSGSKKVYNYAQNIDPEPGSTIFQEHWFEVTTEDSDLFLKQPQISKEGVLEFAPKPDMNGIANLTIILKDDGGTDATGKDTSYEKYTIISIVPVNDQPDFMTGSDLIKVKEDSGLYNQSNWIKNLVKGPKDEDTQVMTYHLTVKKPELFQEVPSISSSGTLTFIPKLNAYGTTKVTVTAEDNGVTERCDETCIGQDTSQSKFFMIEIEEVNDPPTFDVISTSYTVTEDAGRCDYSAWAFNVSAGTEEITQTKNFHVKTINGSEMFEVEPDITPNGTTGNLYFTLKAHAYGKAQVEIYLEDSEGAKSETTLLVLNVLPVNDPPSFSLDGEELNILEDQGIYFKDNWANNIKPGPNTQIEFDEREQDITFNITYPDNFFAIPPSFDRNGTLQFQTDTNVNGSAEIFVNISDSGTSGKSDSLTSATQKFTINVTPVNDAPSFELGEDIVIDEVDQHTLKSYPAWVKNINKGASNETDQVLTFDVTTKNSGLFTELPEIDADGNLTFELKADVAGTALVDVKLIDTGGTSYDGENTSLSYRFSIKIKSINDPPSFTMGTSPVKVFEDCGLNKTTNWITNISAGGGADETAQRLEFELTVVGTDDLFDIPPEIVINDTLGSLTFKPKPNKNGEKTVKIRLKDSLGAYSNEETFIIEVQPKNDPPTFSLKYNNFDTVYEDAGKQTISGFAYNIEPGPTDEESQRNNLAFELTPSNPSLFETLPSISSDGTLTFETKANQNGNTTISVVLNDNQVVLNDNQSEHNLSVEQSFVITINAVNDRPTFTTGPSQIIKEDARQQSIVGWASNISAGASNEYMQTLSFTVEAIDQSLFSVQPQVRKDGMLTYTPASNAFGTTDVRVTLKDNGGVLNGGINTSATQIFTIEILAVNDRPSFTKGADVECGEDEELQIFTNWAKDIDPGPGEYMQSLAFIVTTNNDDLFETIPTINAQTGTLTYKPAVDINAQTGTLTYKPAVDAFGSATVRLYLNDGYDQSDNGNSYMQEFIVTVTPTNDPPSFSITPGDEEVNIYEDTKNALFPNWAKDISAGVNEDQILVFKFEPENHQLFSTQPYISSAGTLSFTPANNANGSANFTVWLEDDSTYGTKRESLKHSLRINIIPVNDQPSFKMKKYEEVVFEDAGSQYFTGWVSEISKGAPNEEAQTLSFHVSTDNQALFHQQPELSPQGDLSFRTAPNEQGTATVTLVLRDDGGSANGGQNVSNQEQFIIKVSPVNDPPSFTMGPDQTIAERSDLQIIPQWARNIIPGPTDEAYQSVYFEATVDKQLFEIGPIISSEGDLSYKPASNASGVATVTVIARDNGDIANGGNNASLPETFTITIEGYNNPPYFDVGENPTVLEDSGQKVIENWAKNISAGGPGEEDQTLTFVLSVEDENLFEELPTISDDGSLTFTPKANEFGETNISVHLEDNGTGSNISDTKEFKIIIEPVNDRPSFSKGQDLVVFENRGEQVIANWATNIKAGPWNEEEGQTLTFQLIPDDPSYFASGPYISELGTLTYKLGKGRHGNISVNVFLKDNGGKEDGGQDTSLPKVFNITVIGINDPPTFSLNGSSLSVLEDEGRQTVSNWALEISPGPNDEAHQKVLFRVSTESDSMFAELPAISTDGVLTYTPKPDASGEVKVTVYLEDDGGTANGGINISNNKEFTINIIGVNDPPSFTKGPDQRVIEDSGAKIIPNWAQYISPGAASEVGQTLTFEMNIDDPSLFAAPPQISSTGTLTYTPAPNRSGIAIIGVQLKDNGGVDYGGDYTSELQQFKIEIEAINDQPTFTLGPNLKVLENSGDQIEPQWIKDISPGASDESDQTLEFNLEIVHPELFAELPKIDIYGTYGTLSYKLNNDISGTAYIHVSLKDDGSNTTPNQNTSDFQSFSIEVEPVNNQPTFVITDRNPGVLEDADMQSINNWAAEISPGAPNEADQTLTFIINTDNNDLFAINPTVSSTDGTLSFQTNPDMNGVANCEIYLHDDGGNENGGDPDSNVETFTIQVFEVNDPPTFIKGSDQNIFEDAGEQKVSGWAKDITAGPTNESSQELSFQVIAQNPSLFSAQPSIDEYGQLTYTPKADTFGSTLVEVTLKDNGGIDNGGSNTSINQFNIHIEPVNDAPSFTPGSGLTVIKGSGLTSITNWATNISAGPNESDQSLLFYTSVSGYSSMFTQSPNITPTGTLNFAVKNGEYGTAAVELYLEDDGGTLNGGKNQSERFTFNITIIDANAPPSFVKGQDQNVLEDCGEVTVPEWATNIDKGAPDEDDQTLEFLVEVMKQDLFVKLPIINEEGTLTFQPAENIFGESTIKVSLKDSGGIANGGDDESDQQEFTITVQPVNDPPEFTIPNEHASVEEDEKQQLAWASDITTGPENESSQALTFIVTTNHPEMFQMQPEITPFGDLTYWSAPDASGEAIVTVKLQDDGGTENGGLDTSNEKHFKIVIQPINDPPVNTSIPWISGTPQTGAVLTANLGEWFDDTVSPDELTYLYQWQKANTPFGTSVVNIPNETASTLTLSPDDQPFIRVKITAQEDVTFFTDAYSRFVGINLQTADIDGNGKVDVADAVLSIQALSGIDNQTPMVGGDIDNDGKIGLADIIYIIVELSK